MSPACVRFERFVVIAILAVLSGCGSPEPDVFNPNGGRILEGLSVREDGLCALDSVDRNQAINGSFHAKAGGAALFSGWAWVMGWKAPANSVAVRITELASEKSAIARTSTLGERGDVASALGIPTNSKVSFEMDGKGLPAKAGTYRVELLQVSSDEVAICGLKYMLVLE